MTSHNQAEGEQDEALTLTQNPPRGATLDYLLAETRQYLASDDLEQILACLGQEIIERRQIGRAHV